MKWFVLAVCSLLVFALIALTAIDKQHERSCIRDGSKSLRAPPGGYRVCQDFLPW